MLRRISTSSTAIEMSFYVIGIYLLPCVIYTIHAFQYQTSTTTTTNQFTTSHFPQSNQHLQRFTTSSVYKNNLLLTQSQNHFITSSSLSLSTRSLYYNLRHIRNNDSLHHTHNFHHHHSVLKGLSVVSSSSASGEDKLQQQQQQQQEMNQSSLHSSVTPSSSTTTTSTTENSLTSTNIIDQVQYRKNQYNFGFVCLSFFLTLFSLIHYSGPGGWRFYLAGGLCAAISHAATTPIDVVKTRQQIDPSLKNQGVIKSAIKIIKNDGGINALLAGLGPTTFGYLFEGSLKFGIYEVMKPTVQTFLQKLAIFTQLSFLNSRVLGFVLSGSMAGMAASVVLCPMEALRIRIVADPEIATKGWVGGGLKMVGREGIDGFWKGLSAMMIKQVPYTVTKNVSFDLLTALAYSTVKMYGMAISSQIKFWIPLISAMLASILSCVSSQPGDMLLSVVNASEGALRSRDYSKQIMKKDGILGFFVGMQARLLHVGMIVTMQLLIYDFVKRLCGIAATGL